MKRLSSKSFLFMEGFKKTLKLLTSNTVWLLPILRLLATNLKASSDQTHMITSEKQKTEGAKQVAYSEQQ